MATRTSRSRKAPRRKRDRYLVRGTWIKIEYFDGFRLRHGQPDDVDIMLWRGDNSPFSKVLERDTLYIDRPYADETKFFVKIYEIETMRKWTRRGDDRRLPPYKEKREYLKRMLCPSGPVPEDEYVVSREWSEEHQLNIWGVRGDVVRKRFDPHFTLGGHDLVYPSYITMPRTVWWDVTDPNEKSYTLPHEISEREKMASGWSYEDAHAFAIQAELTMRVKEYLVEPSLETPPEPLDVVPIAQEGDAMCGPASVKMLLDYDGYRNPETDQPYTETELVALCECNPDLGTDHAPLIRALQKIVGDDGFSHRDGGDIKTLRHIVHDLKRPVLIGWWNGPHRTSEEVRADHELDEGHFSVVKHVPAAHVTFADPWIIDSADDAKSGAGDRTMTIRTFRKRWYDMDGSPSETDPGYHTVRGWYLYLHSRPLEPKTD